MKQIRNFVMALLGVLMCLCLISCPIQGEDEEIPEYYFYIVKSEYDYSSYMYSDYYTNSNGDTLISKLYRSNSHQCLYYIEGDYYKLYYNYNPEKMVILLMDAKKWEDEMSSPNYVLDDKVLTYNPFSEIYYSNEKYTLEDLKEIIKKNDFSRFNSIK